MFSPSSAQSGFAESPTSVGDVRRSPRFRDQSQLPRNIAIPPRGRTPVASSVITPSSAAGIESTSGSENSAPIQVELPAGSPTDDTLPPSQNRPQDGVGTPLKIHSPLKLGLNLIASFLDYATFGVLVTQSPVANALGLFGQFLQVGVDFALGLKRLDELASKLVLEDERGGVMLTYVPSQPITDSMKKTLREIIEQPEKAASFAEKTKVLPKGLKLALCLNA